MSDETTRYSRYESEPPPPPGDGGGSAGSSGGRGWMLAFVALAALAVGVVAGLVINDGDEQTRTVRGATQTVVKTTAPAKTSVGVTITQPERTVERTVTADPVTVTVPAETDDEPAP
ncbi:hypothetical protein [Baekduia sp. Peel2402]|uniref:hypothetical protein n=1 Tax=Baekduia sp. Peel2402 TaxID=3458296 RepID=UPI00403ED2AD